MRSDVDTLRAAYRAFNARDVGAALELMHPHVEWPNAWEGGRVTGREAVRAYWIRQFESIQSTVEPERFDPQPDGTIAVTVRQTVRDAKTDAQLSSARMVHRYRLEEGLVRRMDVEDAPE